MKRWRIHLRIRGKEGEMEGWSEGRRVKMLDTERGRRKRSRRRR